MWRGGARFVGGAGEAVWTLADSFVHEACFFYLLLSTLRRVAETWAIRFLGQGERRGNARANRESFRNIKGAGATWGRAWSCGVCEMRKQKKSTWDSTKRIT